MANVLAPFGLRPVATLGSSTWNQQVRMYYVPSGNTNAFYRGDVVAMAAGGDVVTGASQVDLFGTRNASSNSGAILGVVIGFAKAGGNASAAVPIGADPDNLNIVYVPATKTAAYYLFVCDDPNTIYEVLTDSIASTAFNKNCPIFIANAPTAPNNVSQTYAEGSGANTTNTFPLAIMGAPQRVNNELASPGTYARIYVKLNTSQLAPGRTGV